MRKFRQKILTKMFDREKNIMLNFYMERQRKVKKYRLEQQKLAKVTAETRSIVLGNYSEIFGS